MAQTTIVLNQSAGYTPDASKASWTNNLGSRPLLLQKGTEITVASAVIDVGGNDDSSDTFVFTEDLTEEIKFQFYVWLKKDATSGWSDTSALKATLQLGVGLVNPDYSTVEHTYTLTIPAGKYSSGALADVINRQTRTPTNVASGRAAAASSGEVFESQFYFVLGTLAADEFYYGLDSTGHRCKLDNTKEWVAGSTQGLNVTFDTVAERFKFAYLHTPVTDAGGAPAVEFADSDVSADLRFIGAQTGISIVQWTTKSDWNQSLWGRMGFTQDQLTQPGGFYTQGACTTSLLSMKTTALATPIAQPLTAAYDANGVDRSFAEGTPINSLSSSWSIRIPELSIDWRRDANPEGSIARITRSFASAGFVYGSGTTSFVLSQDQVLQSLTVQILDESGEASTELGSRNSVELSILQPSPQT